MFECVLILISDFLWFPTLHETHEQYLNLWLLLSTQQTVGMSWRVQRQSSKLVGSAQHGSEHSNRQLLASSFLAICMIFSFLLVQQFVHIQCLYSFILLQVQKWPVKDIWECKMAHSVIYRCLKKCMYDKTVYMVCLHTSADLYVWQCTFKFNHVLETISPESVTAASKMKISCSINLLSLLCFSWLHGWLLASIFVTADSLHYGNWNNYWSEH